MTIMKGAFISRVEKLPMEEHALGLIHGLYKFQLGKELKLVGGS